MISGLSTIAKGLSLLILSTLIYAAMAAPNQDDSKALLETTLRGIDHRKQIITGARGLMTLETTVSEPYRAYHAQQLKETYRQYEVPVPALGTRDLACASFAYDENRYVWHLGLAIDSGWDWWGIRNVSGIFTPKDGKPSVGALTIGGAAEDGKTYSVDASSRVCTVADTDPTNVPVPIGVFKARFVEVMSSPALDAFRRNALPRLVGSCRLADEDCYVIAGIEPADPPHGMRRMWVSKDKFIVLRMENVQIDETGEIESCSSQTLSSVVQAAPGVWMPTKCRLDSMGRIENRLVWRWTQRLRLYDLAINQELQLTPADFLFSPSFTWQNESTRQLLWTCGMSDRDEPYVDGCDPALLEIPKHANDMQEWMCRPAN